MPAAQQLLDDVNLRYRNTFTDTQKVFWMNQVQRQIFQLVRHQAAPYEITLVADQANYALPSNCDIKGIEVVAIQYDSDTGADADFKFLPYKRLENQIDKLLEFYSVSEKNLVINPIPDTSHAGRKVKLYYSKRPIDILVANLSLVPDLEEDFHELLILGTLERIAGSRKDVVMKNNYASDYTSLLAEYDEQYSNTDPEFLQPIDVLPKTTAITEDKAVVVTNVVNPDEILDGGTF